MSCSELGEYVPLLTNFLVCLFMEADRRNRPGTLVKRGDSGASAKCYSFQQLQRVAESRHRFGLYCAKQRKQATASKAKEE